MRWTTASRISSIPMPALALARIASSAGMARISSSCFLTDGMSAVRQIDFVDDRNDRQPLLHRQVDIGHRLGLDPLRRIDDQQRPFARRQRAGDFIGKIDVPGGVDQVKRIVAPVLGLVDASSRGAP